MLSRASQRLLDRYMKHTMDQGAPTCYLCGVNECSYDGEPGSEGYFSACFHCCVLTGYRRHAHIYRRTPAQLAASGADPRHTWRTSAMMRPLFEHGQHVGYFCDESRDDRECTHVERLDEPATGDALRELLLAEPVRALIVVCTWFAQAESCGDHPAVGQLRAALDLRTAAEHPECGARDRETLLRQAAGLAAKARNLR